MLQVVRQTAFVATPWKNGGGMTHEALRVPVSGDPFRWRVSVAHIDASGPFSDFAMYNRTMVLLRGAGIQLSLDGHPQELRQVGDIIEFDGATPTHCELLNGPCVDLNLMVLKAERVHARVARLHESMGVSASPQEAILIFSLDQAVTVSVEPDEPPVQLDAWDLAVLSSGVARLDGVAQAVAPPPRVFLATLSVP